jgi:CubicO group peptidase (beta-lactamase class C family)
MLTDANVPGAAVAWTRATGESGTFEHGAADLSTGRPVDPTTAFHLFSGTKLYTAAAVMLLVERGTLSLDEPVKTWLPELPVRADLTVRHLASHASGLPDTLKGFLAVHFAGDPAPTTAAALSRYGLGAGTAPGGTARYGNVNYAILGELVSRVSGRPYVDFVTEALLQPFGVDLSYEDRGGGTAVGHVHRLDPALLLLPFLLPGVSRRLRTGRTGWFVTLTPYSLDTAAIGGLVGCGSAFLPYLREMLSPEDGVLRAASKREMLTLHARGAAGIVSRDGVGIGWKRGTTDGRVWWNHEGGGAGFCSETRLYPDDGLGVVVLVNRSQSRGLSRVCHAIAEAVREAGGLR